MTVSFCDLWRPEVTRTLNITGRDIAGPVLLRPVKPFGGGGVDMGV